MKTLADFKRRCQPGVKLTWEFLAYPPFKCESREVVKVRSNDIVFLNPERKEAFLMMPKASECSFPDDNTILITRGGRDLMKYTFS